MYKHLLIAIFFPLFSFAQLNLNQLGYLDLVSMHSSDASDIWGWVDGSGNEYAIVGLNDGTSVVDVSDPANPVEVFYEPGMNSIWRDIKTWGDYAYVTTEAQNELLIIDLSTLPGNTNLTTHYYGGPSGSEWQSAHNLYIDENGICYIFGANRGNGGAIMLDLTTDPINPTEVGEVDDWYAHDGMVQGDTLYMGHINDGHLSIWDVSDKANPVLLGQQVTPGNFAHNIWVSDDNNYAYTTDEIADGYIGEMDISDPTNIIELDRIQSSPGMDVIPHNTHFLDGYIITSYYRDGVTIHDVSNHGNMVEVGNFDTSPNFTGDGFNGCWGAYPYLPSGNIITSDIEEGLHIFAPNYVRGCYLEGTVTNANTSGPINGVQIEILSTTVTDLTIITGDYATGIAVAGSYDVVYSHPQYYPDTVYNVIMNNGVITTQDAQLVPIPTITLTVDVQDENLAGVPNVQVLIENEDFSFNGSTDASGQVVFTGVYEGTYTAYAGLWGYEGACINGLSIGTTDMSYTIDLESGYRDRFNLDLGWQVTGGAPDGIWEIGEPKGTTAGGDLCNADEDSQDCGEKAYVTGNRGLAAGNDDVDIADMILTSPVMDLTGYADPYLSYEFWWRNLGGSTPINDTLKISITNGSNTVVVQEIINNNGSPYWEYNSQKINDLITPGANMQIIVETADWDALGGHLVEAGFDNFRIYDSGVSVEENIEIELLLFPNPGIGQFTINSNLPIHQVKVFDSFGKVVILRADLGQLEYQFNLENYADGVYFVQIETDNGIAVKPLLKSKQ